VQTQLDALLRCWHWSDVFFKLLDNLNLPRNFLGTVHALAAILPPPLPLPSSATKKEMTDVMNERDRWSALLEKSGERMSELMTILLQTSDRALFQAVVEVVMKIADLNFNVATEFAIRPLLSIAANEDTVGDRLCVRPCLCSLSNCAPLLVTE
jgi:hypothetical protein